MFWGRAMGSSSALWDRAAGSEDREDVTFYFILYLSFHSLVRTVCIYAFMIFKI
jgi:hypothetical protein